MDVGPDLIVCHASSRGQVIVQEGRHKHKMKCPEKPIQVCDKIQSIQSGRQLNGIELTRIIASPLLKPGISQSTRTRRTVPDPITELDVTDNAEHRVVHSQRFMPSRSCIEARTTNDNTMSDHDNENFAGRIILLRNRLNDIESLIKSIDEMLVKEDDSYINIVEAHDSAIEKSSDGHLLEHSNASHQEELIQNQHSCCSLSSPCPKSRQDDLNALYDLHSSAQGDTSVIDVPSTETPAPLTMFSAASETFHKVKRGLCGFINGRKVSAIPDTGASQNTVTLAYAQRNDLQINVSQKVFALGNALETASVGMSGLISARSISH